MNGIKKSDGEEKSGFSGEGPHIPKRRTKQLCLKLLVLSFAVFFAFIIFIFNSPAALRLLVSRFTPAGLTIKTLSGRLAGPIRMEGITYSSKGSKMSIGSIYADWQMTELLSLNLHISRLDIKNITMEAAKKPAKPPSSKPLPSLHLPSFFSVELSNATVENIKYISAASKNKKPFFLKHIGLTAFMRGDTIYIRNMQANAPGYSFSVQGNIKPQRSYTLYLKDQWEVAPKAKVNAYPRAQGSGFFSGTLERLHISQTMKPPYNINADLMMSDLLKQPQWNGRITWHSIQWPLAGKPVASSPEGEIVTDGNQNAYRLSIDAAISVKKGAPQPRVISNRIRIDGEGNMQGLTVKSISGTLLGGKLHGGGNIFLKPAMGWAIAIGEKGLDPGQVSPKWKGNIDYEMKTTGSVSGTNRDIELDLKTIKGRLRGFSLNGSGKFRMKGQVLSVPGLVIRSGRTSITASGRLLKDWNFRWAINSKNLGELLPAAGGALAMKGTMTGKGKKPVVNATLTGRGAAYKTYRLGTLDSAMRIDLSGRTASKFDLTAAGLIAGKRQVQTMRITAAGTLPRHEMTLSAKGRKTVFAMALRGGYKRGTWNGNLFRMDIFEKGYGQWKLPRPAPVNFSKIRAMADICLSNGRSGLCLKADWNKVKGAHVVFAASNVPLGMLGPMMPPGMLVYGTLNGNADIFYANAAATGKAGIRLVNGGLTYSLQGKKVRLSFKESTLTMTSTRRAVVVALAMPFVQGGGINSQLTIFPPKGPPPKGEKIKRPIGITGGIHMHIPNLGILVAVMPSVKKASGIFRADLNISGNLPRPDITGKLMLEKASVTLPTLGLGVDGYMTVVSAGKDRFHIDGRFNSGKGYMAIKGDLARNPAKIWALGMGIKGENFQVIKIPQAQAVASPDLTVSLQDKVARVRGTVTIPQADIKPKGVSGVIRPSPDVVIVSEKRKPVSMKAWKVYADVRIVLGNKISFKGFGLTSTMTGNLAVHEEPGKIATGQGELVITSGKYKAYGQDLDITNGKLLYSGQPVNDPGLLMKATRTINPSTLNEIVVGVNISGTLQQPKLTLFSAPAMDQTETLSYLVLGKPLNSASSSQGNMLYGAATSAGLAGGALIANKIGALFGLKAQVEKTPSQTSSGRQQATLFLGRYLSPRLYVAYGVGIFETSNVFRVRYRITHDWLVQTESGTETGGDVLFKIQWR